MRAGARVPRIDALRGLAVFGIMLVNIWGFVYGYGLVSFPAPGGALSLADQATIFFCAAFAEQKFYPIFSFLFGAGFALQTGGARSQGPALRAMQYTYRRRLAWLLAIGLAHATLMWFGDILVAYALTGFWLATKIGVRPAALVRSLKILVMVNLGWIAIAFIVLYSMGQIAKAEVAQDVQDAVRVHAIYTAGSWSEIARQRLTDYLGNVGGYLFVLPRIALLFMLGVFAVRLGWLRHPERHRTLWRRVLVAGLVLGVPINLWWGLASVGSALNPAGGSLHNGLAASVIDIGGPLLAAAYVAMFMLSGPHVARLLEPVGRMALTNYLMQSLLLMLLLQGFAFGLGAHLTRAGLLGLAAAVRRFQLAFSHWWLARRAQGPMEALWRRYTHER